jgi:hypothetical protein
MILAGEDFSILERMWIGGSTVFSNVIFSFDEYGRAGIYRKQENRRIS